MVSWEEWANQVNEKLTELSNRIDYITRNMALNTQIQSLRTDFNCLRDELVRDIYLERIEGHISLSLRNGPKTQQEVAKTLPDFTQNPMVYHAFYLAWKQWEKLGIILPISHGRGRPRTWELNVLKKEEENK